MTRRSEDTHGTVRRQVVRMAVAGDGPPGGGQSVGSIPRGLEVLVKKAAVDPDFRETLLAKRAGAAHEIDLSLEPAEAAMLGAIPAAQLEAIIDNMKVAPGQRLAFLGKAAAVMIAALGLGAAGCQQAPQVRGVRPDKPQLKEMVPSAEEASKPDVTPPEPAKPAVEERRVVKGIRPDRVTKGIRPDRPKRKE